MDQQTSHVARKAARSSKHLRHQLFKLGLAIRAHASRDHHGHRGPGRADLGFALQARCLEAVANGSVDAGSCVVPVPGRIDAAIARSYLDRKYPATPRT